MKSLELRALDACRKYVAAKADIERLTRAIGAALDACPGTDSDRPTEESHKPTHLSEFYRNGDAVRELASYGYAGTDYKALFDACPHCVKADLLVQQRKMARATFGAAKRFIGSVGRAA